MDPSGNKTKSALRTIFCAESGMEIFSISGLQSVAQNSPQTGPRLVERLLYHDEPLATVEHAEALGLARERGLALQEHVDMEKQWSENFDRKKRTSAFVFAFFVSIEWNRQSRTGKIKTQWSSSVDSVSSLFAWVFRSASGVTHSDFRVRTFNRVRCVECRDSEKSDREMFYGVKG